MADPLVFPRLIYRGDADMLGTGYADEAQKVKLNSETKEVKSQTELDDCLDDGWRLTREDPKDPKTADAQNVAADKAAKADAKANAKK
jgi:hypothetical protein